MGILGGGGANHGCYFSAHLQNSCDNMDRVAMEIGPVLRVGNNEDLRFGHSSQKQIHLFSPINCCTGTINL